MSTVVTKNVQVGTSGTASNNFTLYQPASPDGTVRLANGNSGTTTDLVRIDSSGQRSTNVVSTVGTSYSTLYPAYDCRAWVNFNGTGAVSIRASGNVSSITDNGTGDYTVNFTTAMPDVDYGFSGGGNASGTGNDARGPVITQHTTMSTSALRFYTNRNGDNGAGPVNLDYSIVCVAIFR